MKNKIKQTIFRLAVAALAIVLLLPTMAAGAVSANNDELGYETYTYWYDVSSKDSRKVVYSKPLYEVDDVIGEAELNCTRDSKIVDVHCTNGITYVLDNGASRIIVLDENYNILRTIHAIVHYPEGTEIPATPFLPPEGGIWDKTEEETPTDAPTDTPTDTPDAEGGDKKEEVIAGSKDKVIGGVKYYNFVGAQGIFVTDDGEILIADTDNRRVLRCDSNGYFIREYLLPDSDIIPESFHYSPIKLAVDNKGYVYILSSGSYYGAILYSPDDEFLGFYGANTVASSILQAMQTLFTRLFSNTEKLSRATKALPFSFTDLWIDAKGFVYTVTGSDGTEFGSKGQVKHLNPGGKNVLPSEDVNFTDEDSDQTKMSGSRTQNLTSVTADEQGFIYALDIKYARVFIYDEECTMVSALGGGIGVGEQDGTFRTASQISINGGDLLVADSLANTLTIFKKTDFGTKYLTAQIYTINGDYDDAAPLWEEVFKEDKNCQLAYWGLARSKYVLGEYDEAMELAVAGYDRETYALAFEAVRTNFIRENFTLIAVIAVAIVAVLIAWAIIAKKKNIQITLPRKVKLATTVWLHPFDNFHEIKEKGLASYKISIVVILLYYVFNIMQTTAGGFSFVYYDKATFNSLMILLRTVGLAVLWTIANWAISTLFGGKGKMKEILTVFSYSLIPTLIGSVMFVVLTNVLTLDEGAFLTMFMTIATWYTYILLIIGTMIIHDFEFGEFIGTTLLTLLCMVIVLFLLIVVIILIQQSWGFIMTIYTEIVQLT